MEVFGRGGSASRGSSSADQLSPFRDGARRLICLVLAYNFR